MTDQQHGGMMDSLLGKAEKALDNFLDDPEKVDKAKGKAKDALSKRMDPATTDQVVDKAEELLEEWHTREK